MGTKRSIKLVAQHVTSKPSLRGLTEEEQEAAKKWKGRHKHNQYAYADYQRQEFMTLASAFIRLKYQRGATKGSSEITDEEMEHLGRVQCSELFYLFLGAGALKEAQDAAHGAIDNPQYAEVVFDCIHDATATLWATWEDMQDGNTELITLLDKQRATGIKPPGHFKNKSETSSTEE